MFFQFAPRNDWLSPKKEAAFQVEHVLGPKETSVVLNLREGQRRKCTTQSNSVMKLLLSMTVEIESRTSNGLWNS